MRNSGRFVLFLNLFFIFIFTASAKEWPDNPDFVLESFGTAISGYFSHGLSFKSEGQRIKAWSEGDVVWISSSVPGDGLIVLEHSDGFRSAYSGIEIRPELDKHVSAGEWLGYAGKDSWLFEITDIERSRIVDPITLLPSRNDLSSVSIGMVELVRGTERLELKNETKLSSGR